MQQTETYKLNLIETDDPFSPTPLNENAEALEAQLARVDAALATIPKFAYGTYNGNNAATRTISLTFTPKMVYVGNSVGQTFYGGFAAGGVALKGAPAVSGSARLLEVVEGGFLVANYSSSFTINNSGYTYRYFAIG